MFRKLVILTVILILTGMTVSGFNEFQFDIDELEKQSIAGTTYTSTVEFSNEESSSQPFLGVLKPRHSDFTIFDSMRFDVEMILISQQRPVGESRSRVETTECSFDRRERQYECGFDNIDRPVLRDSVNNVEFNVYTAPGIETGNYDLNASVFNDGVLKDSEVFEVGLENYVDTFDSESVVVSDFENSTSVLQVNDSFVEVNAVDGVSASAVFYNDLDIAPPMEEYEFVSSVGVDVRQSGDSSVDGLIRFDYDQSELDEQGLDRDTLKVYHKGIEEDWSTGNVGDMYLDISNEFIEFEVSDFSIYTVFAAEEPLDMDTGDTVDIISLDIESSKLTQGEQGIITINDRDSGEPVEDAEITINGDLNGQTDQFGEFSFTVPRTEEITVDVSYREANPSTTFETERETTPRRVEQLNVQTTELERGQTTTLLIIDEENNPVPNTEIIMNGEIQGTTNVNGELRFTVPETETVELIAQFQNHEVIETLQTTEYVEPVEPISSLEITTTELIPGENMTVTVTDQNGETLEDAILAVEGIETGAITDEDGEAQFITPTNQDTILIAAYHSGFNQIERFTVQTDSITGRFTETTSNYALHILVLMILFWIGYLAKTRDLSKLNEAFSKDKSEHGIEFS